MSSLPILPSDLIIEILSWLPAKSLVRFRRVSEFWKSLISNKRFAKLHLQRSPKPTHTLLTSSKQFYLHGSRVYYWVLIPYSVRPLLEHPSSILIEDECRRFKWNYNPFLIGSTNGLVCMIGDRSFKDKYQEFWVQFWNPTLRLTSKNSPSLIIPADPNIGFGYDALNDTYKVVAVFWNPTTQEMEGRVHCMGDSCWRKIIIACPAFPILLDDNQIGSFVSGNVNWLALHNLKCHEYEWKYVTINQLAIFSLDLEKEMCKYMLLPDGFSELPEDEPRLAVLKGRLCFYYDYMRTHFVLWEMREFGVHESWTRLVNVSYAHLQIEEPDRLLVPVCLSENGDVLMLANKNPDDVIMYNQRDNRIEYVELPNNQIIYAHEHMQSLVLPRPCPH